MSTLSRYKLDITESLLNERMNRGRRIQKRDYIAAALIPIRKRAQMILAREIDKKQMRQR